MKTKHSLYIFTFLLFVLGSNLTTYGQVVYFDGLGRAITSNEDLRGNITEDDTTSLQNTVSGYTLFDLGVNILPSKNFHARAVLRAKNGFGEFFGTGSALSFREIQLEGIIGEGVYYQIGDIDVELTPYTVFNDDEIYNSFEASAFAQRRDILEYENFNNGNQWRLQGAQTEMSFKPRFLLDDFRVKAFGTRTKPSDNVSIPDRFLVGSQLGFDKDSLFKTNINYTGFFDNPSLGDDYDYTNHVLSADFAVDILQGDMGLKIMGEAGISKYEYIDLITDSIVDFSDSFFDVHAKFNANKKFTADLGFREVGPQFSSPSAQTLRVDPNATPGLFNTVQSGTVSRNQLLYDRLGQENLYNFSVSPILFNTQPLFNNAMAYGDATPNRRGVYLKTAYGDTLSIVRAELNGAFLNEIIGEGTTEKRSFTVVYGGMAYQLGKHLEWKKELAVTVGGKYEQTFRSGNAKVDFSSLLVDAGIDAEVLPKLYLNAGVKLLSGSGREFIATRDQFNLLSSFAIADYEQTEQIIVLGTKYKFGPKSILALNYYQTSYDNELNSATNYSIGQVFINYTMSF